MTSVHQAEPYRWRWLAYGAVLTACVMDLLDSTIAQVAAPAIRGDLGGSYADVQWIAAGYALAMAVALLMGGRLGDMFGRKPMLLAGITGFTVSSLLCAVAPSPEVLIGARVLQGGSGALMLPQTFGLIRDLFTGAEQAKAWGFFGPVMGLSAVAGPVFGGLLIDADLLGTGWRMIFAVNLPLGLFALLIGARFLPSAEPTARNARIDVRSVGLAAAGMFLLIFPLVQGREYGWPLWIFAMLAAALVLLSVFAWRQVVVARSGGSPLVEPSVFRKRSYLSGVSFAVVFIASMGGVGLILGSFLQIGLGFTPIHAALTTLSWPAGAMVGAGFAGATMARLGRKLLHIGLFGMGAGVLWLVLTLHDVGTSVSTADFIAPMLVAGIGMGMIFVPMFDIVMSDVEPHELGSGSGALQAIQQLGMSLGIAVLGTVFFSTMGGASSPDHVQRALTATERSGLISVGLIVVAFGLAFLLPKRVAAPGREPSSDLVAA